MTTLVQIAVPPLSRVDRDALEAQLGPVTLVHVPGDSPVPPVPGGQASRLVAGDAELIEVPYCPGVLAVLHASDLGERLIVRMEDGYQRVTGVTVTTAPLGQGDQSMGLLDSLFGGKDKDKKGVHVTPEGVTLYVTALERALDLGAALLRARSRANEHPSVVNKAASDFTAALNEVNRIHAAYPGVGGGMTPACGYQAPHKEDRVSDNTNHRQPRDAADRLGIAAGETFSTMGFDDSVPTSARVQAAADAERQRLGSDRSLDEIRRARHDRLVGEHHGSGGDQLMGASRDELDHSDDDQYRWLELLSVAELTLLHERQALSLHMIRAKADEWAKTTYLKQAAAETDAVCRQLNRFVHHLHREFQRRHMSVPTWRGSGAIREG